VSVTAVTDIKEAAQQRIAAVQESYGGDRPLPALAGLIGAYGTTLTVLLAIASRRGKLPERMSASDLALYSVATHKLARLIAKDPIASPLRAPFTQLEGLDGPAELHEAVVGEGWRHAVGELLTCPFCLGQWVGTAFIFGGVFAPRATRVIATTFAVHAASDVLQYAYSALESTES
jgi:hypothetical protein